jgi:hypothetical protein
MGYKINGDCATISKMVDSNFTFSDVVSKIGDVLLKRKVNQLKLALIASGKILPGFFFMKRILYCWFVNLSYSYSYINVHGQKYFIFFSAMILTSCQFKSSRLCEEQSIVYSHGWRREVETTFGSSKYNTQYFFMPMKLNFLRYYTQFLDFTMLNSLNYRN